MSYQDMENMNINKEIKFINNFKSIRFYDICKEEKVFPANYYKMEISKEKLLNIKTNIDNKIKKLYEDYDHENSSL